MQQFARGSCMWLQLEGGSEATSGRKGLSGPRILGKRILSKLVVEGNSSRRLRDTGAMPPPVVRAYDDWLMDCSMLHDGQCGIPK